MDEPKHKKYASLSDMAFFAMRFALEDAGFFINDNVEEELLCLASEVAGDPENSDIEVE